MKKILFLFFALLFSGQFSKAQETYFQTGHTHDILEVHFSPDDTQLVSYSAGDGQFILWDVKRGRQIWTRETSFIRKAKESINLKGFHWSKEGKTLVTKSVNGTYQTWDALTGKILALTETKPEIELITPNKKTVTYTRDYENITVTDSESGATKTFQSYGGSSAAVDTSNNSEMFAEGAGWGDAAIKITEIKSGKSWWLDGHPSVVKTIDFSSNGKYLAVGGSDKNIYVFDVAKRNLVKKLVGHTKPIEFVKFSPDGKLFSTGDGFLVSSTERENLRVWDWENDVQLEGMKPSSSLLEKRQINFSPRGKYFVTNGDGLSFEVWDAKTQKVIKAFKTEEKYEQSFGEMTIGYNAVPVNSMKFSKDEKRIFANYADGKIRIWDIDQNKVIKILKYNDRGCHVRVLFDERSFLSFCKGNKKERIKRIDFTTGKVIKVYADEDDEKDEMAFDTEFIGTIEVNPNGKGFVTSDIGGDVLLWDMNKSRPIREFEIGFSGDDAIAFSPDGKTFAVGGSNQNLLLFDVETGEKLWQLIPSYQPSELEIQLEERGKKGRAEVEAKKAERDKQAEEEVPILAKKIIAKFSHYGDAESFWDQKIAESGAANKSKLKLPKEKAKVAWFTLTNDADLPVSIDTNSMIFNPKCKGLCDGAEISSRYVLELKNGEVHVNGFDMYSSAILPPKTTIYFSVALADFAASKAIYLGFTWQKDNPDDEHSNDYGTAQKLYLPKADGPVH